MIHPGMINYFIDEENCKFEWSKNSLLTIEKIINKYPKNKKQSAVIPILDLAQRQNHGWLSKESIEKVAKILNMSFIRVMEIATFYSMFNLKPIGDNFIQICRTTPCWLNGSENLLKVAKQFTGCEIGETSKDNIFTLVEVECLGACCNAPMIQINDEYYEDLNENSFLNLLKKLKKGNSVKKGSQIGRISSEPKIKNNA